MDRDYKRYDGMNVLLVLKRGCIITVSSLVKIMLKVVPVKRNRMIFTSFNGHYSDSPKYISQKIRELDKNVEIVWVVGKQFKDIVPKDVKVIINDNIIKKLWYTYTAKVVVDNTYAGRAKSLYRNTLWNKLKFEIDVWINRKKGQRVFTTWHGTPLKRMGRDQIGNEVFDFSCPDTTMIMGNRFTLGVMDRLNFNKIHMELIGTPRNDLLFNNALSNIEMKEKLGLPTDKKIVLFAPTFRNSGGMAENNLERSGINQLNEIDYDVLFEKISGRFGGSWVFVCRFHYLVEQKVPWVQLSQKYPGKIFNGNIYDDMAEYLSCCDCLITDASSSMFDYMLTKKPCFIYFPDLKYYQEKERGFYFDINELPFPVATDFNQLGDEISSFDDALYSYRVEKLIEELGYVDDENSSERVAEYILGEIIK